MTRNQRGLRYFLYYFLGNDAFRVFDLVKFFAAHFILYLMKTGSRAMTQQYDRAAVVSRPPFGSASWTSWIENQGLLLIGTKLLYIIFFLLLYQETKTAYRHPGVLCISV